MTGPATCVILTFLSHTILHHTIKCMNVGHRSRTSSDMTLMPDSCRLKVYVACSRHTETEPRKTKTMVLVKPTKTKLELKMVELT